MTKWRVPTPDSELTRKMEDNLKLRMNGENDILKLKFDKKIQIYRLKLTAKVMCDKMKT